jgi:DGQHR domain-containing protein
MVRAKRTDNNSVQRISVIVPKNPFIKKELQGVRLCLAALDVAQLMEWWPGKPHSPHRNPNKVRTIQRSLDWKRVAQIAAYLVQREITDAPGKLAQYFDGFYGAEAGEPGREWPPKVPKVAKFQRSGYPTFSNVLLHVNGAKLEEKTQEEGVGLLEFDEDSAQLNFSVIDGQHRINGAYFAVCLLREAEPQAKWEIPAEVFMDLDEATAPPRRQAQIFIDVNFYQKKVDRSLVADLFPTARGARDPLDDKERAQDLGRKLMLETGPLVGMVQIPGIRFGVKDVVTLSTLNSAIEDVLDDLRSAGAQSLEAQADFIAQCLDAWLDATGRKEDVAESESLDPENVAYQGRAIVSFLTLVPACILELKQKRIPLVSDRARAHLCDWAKGVMKRARLLDKSGRFLAKGEFKHKGYLGSGGIARFRDALWAAATATTRLPIRIKAERLEVRAHIERAFAPLNRDRRRQHVVSRNHSLRARNPRQRTRRSLWIVDSHRPADTVVGDKSQRCAPAQSWNRQDRKCSAHFAQPSMDVLDGSGSRCH